MPGAESCLIVEEKHSSNQLLSTQHTHTHTHTFKDKDKHRHTNTARKIGSTTSRHNIFRRRSRESKKIERTNTDQGHSTQ